MRVCLHVRTCVSVVILLTQNVDDPAVMVTFPILNDTYNASFVAWTTTPWTLPSNLALCVNPEFTYVRVGAPSSVMSGHTASTCENMA